MSENIQNNDRLTRGSQLPNISQAHGFPSGIRFWVFGFLFASLLALMFQKLILPQLPALHAGNGLLHNDAVIFHNLALKGAEQITQHGWAQWRLFPDAAGNVGVLSAVYALFGPEPAFFIPINAAAHATGALMIYLLGQRLWPGKVGSLGGLVAGIMFLSFPSALQWYGQNHKDAFAIAGILLMLYAWLTVLDDSAKKRWGIHFVLMLSGAVLLAIVRPYFPVLVLCAFGLSWIVCLLGSIIKGRLKTDFLVLLKAVVLLIGLLLVSLVSASQSAKLSTAYGEQSLENFNIEFTEAGTRSWVKNRFMPDVIDRQLARASTVRAHFIAFSQRIGAGSAIDAGEIPNDVVSMLCYMPRAMIIGFFAPFPNQWTERVSAVRLVGAVETLIWYVVSFGLFVLLLCRPSRPLVAGLVFVGILITMLSYVHPNIGTLYRHRFGLWFFVLLAGATGWAKVFLGLLASDRINHVEVLPQSENGARNSQAGSRMESIAASGSVVMLVTFCCYIGFMARDFLLINTYGINVRMDAFFSATMIPMFFVTFLALPIPDALTSSFLKSLPRIGSKDTESPERTMLFFALILFGTVTVLVVLFAEHFLPLILSSGNVSSLSEGILLLRIFSPVIFLSAWTIVANTILNSLAYSRQAAMAQLVVPVIAISAILMAPFEYGLRAATIGMVIGTLVNAVISVWLTRRLGYVLWPRIGAIRGHSNLLGVYSWLVIASFCTATLTPINYYFASTIEHGAITAWAFASKIVMLINGLAGVGITAVVLPHFGKWTSRGNMGDIKHDVFFFLLAGTWIGIIIAIIIFIFSEPMAFALLNSRQVTDQQIGRLSDIIKIGCLQLPMVISNAILVKVVAVSRKLKGVVVSALCMISINVVGNIVLVPIFSVLGLAFSSVAATGASTALLMIIARKSCSLGSMDVAVLLAGWVLLSIIGLGFHFGGMSAAAMIVLGITALLFVHRFAWKTRAIPN